MHSCHSKRCLANPECTRPKTFVLMAGSLSSLMAGSRLLEMADSQSLVVALSMLMVEVMVCHLLLVAGMECGQ